MPNAEKMFDGKAVIVVGGGAGIGRQYCLDLAVEGAGVLVSGHGPSIDAVVTEIRDRGGIAEAFRADVREGQAIIDEAIRHFARIDGLVVNAGILRDRSFAKMSGQEWRDVLDVHLEGTHACVKAVWPVMSAQGGGRIVLTTSGAGVHGNFGQANYAAAKGATIALMRTLALEGAPRGIYVNAIAPMAMSQLTAGLFSPELVAALPPRAVSPYVLALLHPDCKENGSLFDVGGGWCAKVRVERAAGYRAAPESVDLREVMAHWDDVVRFDDKADHPATSLQSLAGAVGPEMAQTFGIPQKK